MMTWITNYKTGSVFVLGLYSSFTVAQVDLNNKPLSIPSPTTHHQQNILPIPINNNLLNPPKTNNNFLLTEEPKSIGFGEKNTFSNPNKNLQDNLNAERKGVDLSKYRRDQYLGDISTDSKTVRILFRDHKTVDGDKIKISVNDKVIAPSVELYASFSHVSFDLTQGFNKIDFEALNMGKYPPNTAEFIIYDDVGRVITRHKWIIATGHKATFIVVKE